MTPEQIEIYLHIQKRQMEALESIAESLKTIVLAQELTPDIKKDIGQFKDFDWDSINATILKSDQYGAAVVDWNGKQFIRRSPSNKFGEAIWFSNCYGKSEDGKNLYKRLITFKKMDTLEAEEIPVKTQRHL